MCSEQEETGTVLYSLELAKDHHDDNGAVPDCDETSLGESSLGSSATGSVRFASWQEVHEVPSMSDISLEESQAIWYDAQEYHAFSERCRQTVQKMETDVDPTKQKQKPIGLELWTTKGYRKRLRRRCEALDIVLDEQFAQWADGVDDLETIAELYRARSADSKLVAESNGLALEREVQRYHANAPRRRQQQRPEDAVLLTPRRSSSATVPSGSKSCSPGSSFTSTPVSTPRPKCRALPIRTRSLPLVGNGPMSPKPKVLSSPKPKPSATKSHSSPRSVVMGPGGERGTTSRPVPPRRARSLPSPNNGSTPLTPNPRKVRSLPSRTGKRSPRANASSTILSPPRPSTRRGGKKFSPPIEVD